MDLEGICHKGQFQGQAPQVNVAISRVRIVKLKLVIHITCKNFGNICVTEDNLPPIFHICRE